MDVFDLFAKLSLDTSEYEKGLDDAEQKAKSSGFGKALGDGLKTAAKVGVAAVGAASAAIGGLTAKSVESYAEYEQLVGGVQKLYGNMGMSLEEYAQAQGKSVDEVRDKWQELEEAQNLVTENAKQAYRTAGMSMNEYMDTATSFSAALINSLGGDTLKAAEQTDLAMRAISDNFNTFGGDIEGVKNAFMGFAKQNYTMLDNLKLGYGGTKEGMEQLIADANEYAASIGQASDLSIDSFADIVTAIDLVQQKQGIAGTTAREASTTIQGSLGMVAAAWENLLTGMADGESDMDALMGNLVDSIAGTTDEAGNHINGLIDNVLPAVETALNNIGSLIEKIAPIIGTKIPELVESLAPTLISAGASLIGSIVKGIAENIDGLLDMLLNLAGNIFNSLGTELPSLLDTLLSKIPDIIEKIANAISEGLPTLIDGILSMIESLADKIQDPSGLTKIITAGVNLIVTLAKGIVKAIPRIIKVIPQIIKGLVNALTENLPVVIDGIISLIDGILSALPDIILAIVEAIPEIITTLIDAIVTNLPVIIDGLIRLVGMIVTHLPEIVMALIEAIPDIIASILDAFGGIVDGIGNLFGQAWEGIKGAFSGAGDWFKDTFEKAKEGAAGAWNHVQEEFSASWEGIKNIFGGAKDHFSKEFTDAKNGVTKVWSTIGNAFSKNWEAIKNAFNSGGIGGVAGWFREKFSDAVTKIKEAFSKIGEFFVGIWNNIKEAFHIEDALQWGKDLISNFVNGIKDMVGQLGNTLQGVGQDIKDFLGFSEPKKGPLSNFHTYAPDMMKLFAEGVDDNAYLVTDAVQDAFDFKDMIDVPAVEYRGAGSVQNMDSVYLQKMVQLMERMLDRGMDVTLTGDAADIFRVVERENRITTKATGYNRLSMAGVY